MKKLINKAVLPKDLWNAYARATADNPWLHKDLEAVMESYRMTKGDAIHTAVDIWLMENVRRLDRYRQITIPMTIADDVDIACILTKKTKQEIVEAAIQESLLAILESEADGTL